jgi:ABC-type bacteriocin/lantibiotic exporter with double-glycine peptidase domain
MSMTALPSSIDQTARCLSVVLERHGIDVNAHALTARVGNRPSLEAWEREVRALGLAARFVRLNRSSLERVALPTVVLRDGALPCVMRALRGRTVELTSAMGEAFSLPLDALLDSQGSALEVDCSLSALSTLRARLIRRMASERTALIQLGSLALLVSLLGLLAPLLTQKVIDQAVPNGANGLLLAVVSGLVLCGAQRAWLGYLRERIAIGLGGKNSHALFRDGLISLLSQPYAVQSQSGLGPKLQFLASTESVARFFMATGVKSLIDALFGLAAWLCVCTWSVAVAAVLAGASLLVLAISLIVARRHARFRAVQLERTAEERARLHELLVGITTIKAAGAERSGLRRWLESMVAQNVARLRAELTSVSHQLVFATFAQGTRLLVFVWGSEQCLSSTLSVGAFVALMMLTDSVTGSVRSVGDALLGALASSADAAKVDALLAHAPEEQPSTFVPATHSERYAVVMDDVWFRYGPDKPWILRGYSLRLEVGEQLVLRSASGTGKSTILRLIAGLHRPERGSVSVFGRDPAQARAHIAYLPQQAYLFAGSIRHNLELLSGASLEELAEACDLTGLSAFLATLPMGLDTVVPAGGSSLSGGQRQWILLTAALASHRKLLLMDESLSHLDGLTRARLRHSASFTGRSVIWVSHDE